ncbi:unnamed protein product [Rangifer tarandus platyrhynchus]|uniref:Uncharacterized protein n=2 Tax=Rangifer tarandus platyrhynchus TaxID=3082113 RepID=A0ABN9A0P3_RANTA|nr:unnamed protein product [Rangifer tarandus platyrhynchus]
MSLESQGLRLAQLQGPSRQAKHAGCEDSDCTRVPMHTHARACVHTHTALQQAPQHPSGTPPPHPHLLVVKTSGETWTVRAVSQVERGPPGGARRLQVLGTDEERPLHPSLGTSLG